MVRETAEGFVAAYEESLDKDRSLTEFIKLLKSKTKNLPNELEEEQLYCRKASLEAKEEMEGCAVKLGNFERDSHSFENLVSKLSALNRRLANVAGMYAAVKSILETQEKYLEKIAKDVHVAHEHFTQLIATVNSALEETGLALRLYVPDGNKMEAKIDSGDGGRQVSSASAGEKGVIITACKLWHCIYTKQPIVTLDEAWANFSPDTREAIKRWIQKHRLLDNCALLVVDHGDEDLDEFYSQKISIF